MTTRIESTLTVTDVPIIGWNNVVTSSNVFAESEADYPASNVANPSTALKWVHETSGSPVSATEYFTIDTAQSDSINYVAIAGHNFSSGGIAVGLEFASFNSPLGGAESIFEPQIPADDSPLIFLFSQREIEGVRIILTTTSTAAEMAVIYVGEYMEMEEGIQADHSPLPLANAYEIMSGRSENGQFLGRLVLSHQYQSSATFSNMSKAWIRSDLMPFLNFAAENPFFYLWSPLTYPDETAFAWLDNDPQPIFDIDGYGSVDLSMRGQAA
jgi:hypothetical protein